MELERNKYNNINKREMRSKEYSTSTQRKRNREERGKAACCHKSVIEKYLLEFQSFFQILLVCPS